MTVDCTYLEFSDAFHRRVAGQRLPISVQVEVTRRCPLECSHCYNNLPMADLETARQEMTLAEHRRMLDELADLGCLWLCYTGGEIFARRDFLDIYTYAKSKGFIITLFTNGTLITPKIADHLAEWRPFTIEVTLYGRTRETYERLTRVPGSYDRCLRGIQLLKERNLPVSLKTVAVTVNRHEIWDMKRFVEDELGLAFKFDSAMTARIDCSLSPLAVRLSPEQCVELDLQDPGRVEEWQRFSSQYVRATPHLPGNENEVYSCGGGLSAFAVDPLGQMSICVLSHRDNYDVRKGTLAEGWEHFLKAVRDRKTNRVTKCTHCHLRAVCGMCPANGELENGDPESPVDFLCHTAHLRAELMGWAVVPHGECEYCEGGVGREGLVEEAKRLRAKAELGFPDERPQYPLLPAFGEPAGLPAGGCSTGGCGSCGAH